MEDAQATATRVQEAMEDPISIQAAAADIPFVEVHMDNMVFNLQAEGVQKEAVFVEVESFTRRLEAYTQAAIAATLKNVPNLITGIAERTMAPSVLPTPGALPAPTSHSVKRARSASCRARSACKRALSSSRRLRSAFNSPRLSAIC